MGRIAIHTRTGVSHDLHVHSRVGPRLLTAAIVALLTLGAFFAFLAWDRHKTRGSDGYLHGPYEPWQVIAVVVVIAGAAVWAGRRGNWVTGTVVATVAMTVAWSVNAATDPDNDGLWPVGALLVCLGTLLGFFLVSTMVARPTDYFGTEHAPPGSTE